MLRPRPRTSLLLALVLAAGCGGTSEGGSPSAAAPGSSAAPTSSAPSPVGTWTRTTTALPTGGPNPHKILPGEWTLKLGDTSFLTNPQGGTFPIGGMSTSIFPAKLVFGTDLTCLSQTSLGSGTYTYTVTADTLTLKLVSDACHDRSTVFNGYWARKG